MPRPATADPTVHPDAALPDDARAAIAEQAANAPEWRPWLDLLEVSLRAGGDQAWPSMTVSLAGARPRGAPILHGARLAPDAAAVRRLVDALLETARPHDPAQAPKLEPLAVVAAGIRQDEDGLADLAREAGLDNGVLATVAGFAARPLLLDAARRASSRVPPDWTAGYCPVCAGWPILVELRGLERRRVLRCGRCATGWERPVLLCPFCGERDHRRQGSLVPAGDGDRLRLETCASCLGYVKTVTTLRPRPAWALPLDDLRTVELELAAVERGFRRPETPGWALELAVS